MARQAVISDDVPAIVGMIGAISFAFASVVTRPRRFRLTSAIHQLDEVGWRAIPVIVIVTALLGGIIAQQGVFYFRQLGVSGARRRPGRHPDPPRHRCHDGGDHDLRPDRQRLHRRARFDEDARGDRRAPRSSALDPVEVLVLPRIVALILAMLILSVIGDLASLVGGGLVCWFYGGMNPSVFMAQLKAAVTLNDFLAGVIKAPFMALAVGVVRARRASASREASNCSGAGPPRPSFSPSCS